MKPIKFFVTKKGGIKDPETQELRLLEGTAEKGPWYRSDQFTDAEVKLWFDKEFIEFMGGE